MSSKRKKILIGIAVIIFLALFAQFDGVADWVSEKTGMATEKVKSVAKGIVFLAVGAFLVYSGIAALAVPVLGIALVAIGVILLGVGIWNLFSRSGEATPEDNANMGGQNLELD